MSDFAVPSGALAQTISTADVRRYRPLGAFRFVLALMVVEQHFLHLLPESGRGVFSQLGLGAIAVAVFFIVSGFIVTEANMVFYAGRPVAFFANRLLRVVPPYLAALVLSVCVHALLWHAGQLELWDYTLQGSPLRPSLLLSGMLGILPGFHTKLIGPDFEFIPFAWSLRVEIAFYIAAACALFSAQYWRGAVPAALALGLAGSAAFLTEMRPGLLSNAPMFLLGIAICLVLERRSFMRVSFLVASLLASAAGFVSWRQHGTPVLSWQLAMLACLVVSFIWLATAKTPEGAKRLDKALGALSYPLYLNHYAVGLAVYNLLPSRSIEIYAVTVACSIVIAWVMAEISEVPFFAMRDRLRKAVI